MLAVLLLSFSLNPLSISAGKVCPFSQISMSFLILSYNANQSVSWWPHRYEQSIQILQDHMYDKQDQCHSSISIQHVTGVKTYRAYLLILGCCGNYIVHQYWQQFLYSMDACTKGAILGGCAYGLTAGLCLLSPFASYRVYDVENAQLVSCRSFLEMSV
jgi:hypothetical protein